MSKSQGAFFRDSAPPRQAKADEPFDPDAPFDVPPLPESEIDNWLEALTADQKSTLAKIIKGKTEDMGYQSCREGGAVWLRAQALVSSDLIRREIYLDEIELN